MQVRCVEERHPAGGQGVFMLGKAEELAEELLKAYRGQVQLIYLDPPFGTGDTFSMKIGEGKQTVTVRLYDDKKSSADYLDWMRMILSLCHALLSSSGSLYLHLDYRMSARCRCMLDEIFGENNFMNEIIWTYKSGGRSKNYFPRKHDTILFYRKSKNVYFNIDAVGIARGSHRRNHMKRFIDEDGRIGFSIRSKGKLYKYYEDGLVYPSDVWNDIEHLQQKDRERTGFLTQKPEALLRRIICASSKEGDLVLDLFSGSGTTAAVAAKLNRRFAVCDSSPVSMQILRKRLLTITGTMDLFDSDSSSLILRYPDSTDDNGEISCDIHKEGSKTFINLNAVTFPDSYPLSYIATGTMDNASFMVYQTVCSPKLPLKLACPDEGPFVIQVENAVGQRMFFGSDNLVRK